MKIKDILKSKGYEVFTINENEKVCEASHKLTEYKVGALMVTNDKGDISGILSERDILKCDLSTSLTDKIVKDIMTPAEKLIVATPDDDIKYAMNIMTEKRIKHLPVFSKDKMEGIISIGDVVKAQLDNSEFEAKTYLDYILGKLPQSENLEY